MTKDRSVRRVSVVAEEMTGTLDEGGRKFAYSLAGGFRTICDTQAVSIGGARSTNGVVRVPPTRTFATGGIRRALRKFAPDLICYVPSASMTTFSVARARVLKAFRPSATVALVALQPRTHGLAGRSVISLAKPDIVFGQSEGTVKYAESLGMRSALLPPAVNLERFRPVDAETKRAQRSKHGLHADKRIVLHVGHAKPGRGVEALAGVQEFAQAVLVTGRSTGIDTEIVRRLTAAGVIVIDSYVERVEEIFQASDAYVFPVESAESAIEMPLSVLEAMACNLPVVATRYGGLPDAFGEATGLTFVGSAQEAVDTLRSRDWEAETDTRSVVADLTWANVASEIIRKTSEVKA